MQTENLEIQSPNTSKKRYLRNFLLQPILQIKLGLYSILLTIVFSTIICTVIYVSFARLYELVIDLTDLREEVIDIIGAYMSDIAIWLLVIVFIYVALNIVMTVLFTHTLVGPTIAFRRHIQALRQGNYASRVTLRKKDAFGEVAEALNELAITLDRKKGS